MAVEKNSHTQSVTSNMTRKNSSFDQTSSEVKWRAWLKEWDWMDPVLIQLKEQKKGVELSQKFIHYGQMGLQKFCKDDPERFKQWMKNMLDHCKHLGPLWTTLDHERWMMEVIKWTAARNQADSLSWMGEQRQELGLSLMMNRYWFGVKNPIISAAVDNESWDWIEQLSEWSYQPHAMNSWMVVSPTFNDSIRVWEEVALHLPEAVLVRVLKNTEKQGLVQHAQESLNVQATSKTVKNKANTSSQKYWKACRLELLHTALEEKKEGRYEWRRSLMEYLLKSSQEDRGQEQREGKESTEDGKPAPPNQEWEHPLSSSLNLSVIEARDVLEGYMDWMFAWDDHECQAMWVEWFKIAKDCDFERYPWSHADFYQEVQEDGWDMGWTVLAKMQEHWMLSRSTQKEAKAFPEKDVLREKHRTLRI